MFNADVIQRLTTLLRNSKALTQDEIAWEMQITKEVSNILFVLYHAGVIRRWVNDDKLYVYEWIK